MVSLKVDVCTHDGLKYGVPRLASLLEEEGIRASFFVAMGPDNSGKALKRIFKNRGFLKKMLRTRAVALYGIRTILSGTLLPARLIAPAFPEMLRQLLKRGFAVEIHGFDHVLWQDNLERMDEREIRAELDSAVQTYRTIIGDRAVAFGAPGWRVSNLSLLQLSKHNFFYQSNTRGREPYRCYVNGQVLDVPEIPTTMPTLDELIGRPGLQDANAIVSHYIHNMSESSPNVHTVHAEVEGGRYIGLLRELIRKLKERNARFVRPDELVNGIDASRLPVCKVEQGYIEGRAGWVSVQGEELK